MSSVEQMPAPSAEVQAEAEDSYAEALKQLEKKREFRIHLSVYLSVNALLWLIWGVVAAVDGFSFPWPVFPLAGWGIGIGFHAWDVYGRRPFSAEQIEREAARLRSAR